MSVSHRILLISDLHCGSGMSIAHPQARINAEGATLGLNKIQQYTLWPLWKKMCETKEPYDLIVVNGDLVDGKQSKSGHMGLWTADMDCQAECAAKLLDMIPLKKGGEVHIIKGTDYHRGNNLCADSKVVDKFNRLQRNRDKNAVDQGLEYVLKIDDCTFHIAHTIGGGQYLGTALNKEVMFRHLYHYEFTGMIRGHRHNYHFDSDGDCFGLLLPCWKGRDDYEKKHGLKWISMVGWVEMVVDGKTWDVTPHLTKLEGMMKEVEL